MRSGTDLSLSIPMWNEESCAEEGITELTSYLGRKGVSYEIIAVNNGSVDGTGKILERLARKNSRIKVVTLKKNQGYGGGILAGMKIAGGKYVGFTCADGQISPEDTYRVYAEAVRRDADLAKGDRENRDSPTIRKILTAGYWFGVNAIFMLGIKDVNGYPVIMKREVFRKLRVQKRDWLINLEMLHKVRRMGRSIVEVEVTSRKRRKGRSHVRWHTVISFLAGAIGYRLRSLK